MEEIIVAKKLALSAGEKILDIYKSDKFLVEMKKDDSPLTLADTLANDIIVSGIKEEFPDHAILTEESRDNKSRVKSEYVWIIDPLDGTKEFISKNGEFTVNIALVRQNRPVLGVIYLPVKKKIYYAIKGQGAFIEENGRKKQISVSDRKDEELVVIKSRSHASKKLEELIEKNNFKKVLTAGSSLKGCLVARGEADVYYRLGPTNEWDICAMNIIVEEAGGKMTDFEGNRILYNQKDTLINGFLISNNTQHKKLLENIKND